VGRIVGVYSTYYPAHASSRVIVFHNERRSGDKSVRGIRRFKMKMNRKIRKHYSIYRDGEFAVRYDGDPHTDSFGRKAEGTEALIASLEAKGASVSRHGPMAKTVGGPATGGSREVVEVASAVLLV
jgi:hypothetical protein